MQKDNSVTGWPALVFIVLVLLGLADVVERLVAAVV